MAVGEPAPDTPDSPADDGSLGAGRTTYGDGRSRVLAYADPDVALRTLGSRFNAGLPGEVLLRMAADDPECDGILVNSATQPNSIIITRSTAAPLRRDGHE
ncbi:hypothetical protein ACWEOZ_28480 [Actinoplanes sp. NPDC004185]